MGHIQKKTRNGTTRFIARYTGPDGKEYSKSFIRKGDLNTPGTAAHWLNEQESNIRSAAWASPHRVFTFQQWAEQWVASRTGILDYTRYSYEQMIKTDVTPHPIGAVPLRNLTKTMFETWINDMGTTRPWSTRGPLSPNTVTTRRNVFATILRDALDEGYISRNPLKNVKAETRSQKEPSFDPGILPSANDIWAIYSRADPIFREIVLVAAGTGMRCGEILGLRPKNVIGNEIHVVEQVIATRNGVPAYGPPKTPKARRRIPIGKSVQDALTRHLAFQPDTGGPIFRQPSGDMWRRSTFWSTWNRARIDFPGLKFHTLRRYYASVLIRNGADIKTVMERMGHATAEETIVTYARLWPNQDARTSELSDLALQRDEDGI